MSKIKLVSVLTAMFLFGAGSSLVMGEESSTKSLTPPNPITEHATHDASAKSPTPSEHEKHEAGKPIGEAPPSAHTDHDMGQMSGMDELKKQDEEMMAHMKSMQILMEKINATENSTERKMLMHEHMTAMASGIIMMREKDDKMMMGMMKSGKCPMMEMMSTPQGQAGMKEKMGDMTMCHQMMQKKADMSYSMMEQIIESQKQLLKIAP